MIPLIQKEINSFVLLWNSHRIRKQSDTVLPDGIPNHIYNFPENYDLRECGWKVSDEQLREVAELSGVLQVHDDYLDSVFRAQCERLLPDPSNLEPADCGTAFLFLCEHI
ncbi:Hypothetical predicted protein [Paramuricea clavata]|uniref:Uncharacterized protein n=1 Tax=Paramuricea clavata TaxID=317549 RepID=A0A6S7FJU2_PARCT|nr:Hypothetical predicted protein [Paramuricea clavata]